MDGDLGDAGREQWLGGCDVLGGVVGPEAGVDETVDDFRAVVIRGLYPVAGGGAALAEAIEFFQEHPHFSAAQLEHAWTGTPKGAALSRLASESLDVEGGALQTQFLSVLKSLRERSVKAPFDALMQRQRPPVE